MILKKTRLQSRKKRSSRKVPTCFQASKGRTIVLPRRYNEVSVPDLGADEVVCGKVLIVLVAFQCYSCSWSCHNLPLSLLPGQELVQCSNNLLQRREVLLQLLLDLRLITAQLRVEVLPVGRSAHGGAEERLDDERVVGLEGVAVGITERVGELLVGVGDVVAEGLGGEVEAAEKVTSDLYERQWQGNVPVKPDKTLGGSVLLLLELVEDEVLESFRECGGSELAVANFL